MKNPAKGESQPSAWLAKADKDLWMAELAARQSDPPGDLITFHAQQCVEKYLKGALTHFKVRFPKTHDLEELCRLLNPHWPNMPFTANEVVELTDYAISSRYPDEWDEISLPEALLAIDMAKRVKAAVLVFLKEKGYEG
jgi:HEPN domain-containing protein